MSWTGTAEATVSWTEPVEATESWTEPAEETESGEGPVRPPDQFPSLSDPPLCPAVPAA